MSEELENTPYLYLSSNRFGIYLYDKKENKNIFKCEIELQNKFEIIDVNEISNFVENNIFKIEKLIGKFIKNITLIIDSENILLINVGLKKKKLWKYCNKKISWKFTCGVKGFNKWKLSKLQSHAYAHN